MRNKMDAFGKEREAEIDSLIAYEEGYWEDKLSFAKHDAKMKEEEKHEPIRYEQCCWSYKFVFRLSHFEKMYEDMKDETKDHWLYKNPKRAIIKFCAIITLYSLNVSLKCPHKYRIIIHK